MQPLVSVIVPVYNVEKYLVCCLNSIIEQSYQNLDIILVNDGSTDGSGELCRQYKQRDSRIRLFEQENMGLSAARNTGLDNMQGDYVVFVDSDDYIAPYMIEILLKKSQEYKVSVVVCDYLIVKEEKDKVDFGIMPENGQDFGKKMSRDEVFNYMGTEKLLRFIVVWGKLYDKKIFEKIRFIVGKKYEDEFIFSKIYRQVDEIYNTELCMCAYRQSPNSIMRKNGVLHHCMDDLRELGVERLSFFQEYGNPEYMRRARKMLLYMYVYNLDWSNKQELKENIKKLEREVYSITGKKTFWFRFAVMKYFPDEYQYMRKIYLKIKPYFEVWK